MRLETPPKPAMGGRGLHKQKISARRLGMRLPEAVLTRNAGEGWNCSTVVTLEQLQQDEKRARWGVADAPRCGHRAIE